jgi:hypothetical protein
LYSTLQIWVAPVHHTQASGMNKGIAPPILDIALDADGQLHTPAAVSPVNKTLLPTEQGARWAQGRSENYVASARNRTRIVRFVAWNWSRGTMM